MMSDILTVMWKERKGLLRFHGSRTRSMLTLLIPALMLGIVLPLQIGRELVTGPWSLLASVLIPLMLVGMMIPESFAGERERHTLETLLASRLPDRAILFGKAALAVAYGWTMTLMVLLLSLVTLNVAQRAGQLLLYTPTLAVANLALSLLLAGLMAGLGVLISLRSATVQGAQQTLMTFTLLPLMLLQAIPFLFLSVVPDGRARLRGLLAAADPTQIMLVVISALVAIDAALLALNMARFRRDRLVLE